MDIIIGRSATFNRVLVVDNQGIMGAGLERQLSEKQHLEVFGLATENETTLIRDIWRLQPDIIILVFESQVIAPIRLLELLPDYGRLRIVLLSTESNVIDVFDRQHTTITSPNCLLEQLKDK